VGWMDAYVDDVETPKPVKASRNVRLMSPEEERVSLGEKVMASPVGGVAEYLVTNPVSKFGRGMAEGAAEAELEAPRALETMGRAGGKFLFGERQPKEGLWGKLKRSFVEGSQEAVLPTGEESKRALGAAAYALTPEPGRGLQGQRPFSEKLQEGYDIQDQFTSTSESGKFAGTVATAAAAVPSVIRGIGSVLSKGGKAVPIGKNFYGWLRNYVANALKKGEFRDEAIASYIDRLYSVGDVEKNAAKMSSKITDKITEGLSNFKKSASDEFAEGMDDIVSRTGDVPVDVRWLRRELDDISSNEALASSFRGWAKKLANRLHGDEIKKIPMKRLEMLRRNINNRFSRYKTRRATQEISETQGRARDLERAIVDKIESSVGKVLGETPEANSLRLLKDKYRQQMVAMRNMDRYVGPRSEGLKGGGVVDVTEDAVNRLKQAVENEKKFEQIGEYLKLNPQAGDNLGEFLFVEMVRDLQKSPKPQLGAAGTVGPQGFQPRFRGGAEYFTTAPERLGKGFLRFWEELSHAPLATKEGVSRAGLLGPGGFSESIRQFGGKQ
jgi:hypothetical protein